MIAHLDLVRYVSKVEKVPMTLGEGFKVELINKKEKGAVPANNFLLRLGELLPGRVHPGVKEIHDKAEHAFYVLDGDGEIIIQDETFELHPDTAVLVPQGFSHQLKNTGSKPLRWVVIYAPLETSSYLESPEGVLMYYESAKKKQQAKKSQ
jgi:mannose-6-phosphate isomerase-like protein (cupin superfamily)